MMTHADMPFVSVVTPVYNNERYLAECVESVLAQTYKHWDYTIVNNCSIDRSGNIAEYYAAMDPRIRVVHNQDFLELLPNHNHAMRQISPNSKYCKVVFADDWIFPRCLEEMVSLAEAHPSVGIVGAYGLEEYRIAWSGLSHSCKVVPGREICRRMFLENLYVFGTAGSLLYRSDLVRARDPFFDESNFHADREVCTALLRDCDFGFVHQVLTFKRLAADSMTVNVGWDYMTHYGALLATLLRHGPDILTRGELNWCIERCLKHYYNFLAVSLLRGRTDRAFWDYQKAKLIETVGFSNVRLAHAVAARVCRMVFNLHETIEKLRFETHVFHRHHPGGGRSSSAQNTRLRVLSR